MWKYYSIMVYTKRNHRRAPHAGLFDHRRETMSEPQLDPGVQKSEHARHFASAAPGWMKWWAINGRALQPIGDRMCELAEIRPGQRVLDIATGIGEPALTVVPFPAWCKLVHCSVDGRTRRPWRWAW